MNSTLTGRRGTAEPTRSRRRGDRRGLSVALAASALAHMALIVLYPFFSGRYPTAPLAPYEPPTRDARGIRVVRIVEVTSPEAGTTPEDPLEVEEVEQPEIVAEVPGFEEEIRLRSPELYRYLPAWERLRLSQGDRRLWRRIDPALTAPTPDQILNLEIAAAIEAGHDSAAAEAERARRALDWTHTDEDGRRWGVSPGKIHLGEVTIPLPFGFGPPPDYNGDRAEWAFRMADIERAARTLAVRRSLQERNEVMKKRREEQARKEKEEKEKGKAVVPPVARPDTTSGRPRRR